MTWYHPKYYAELRKIRAASFKQQASGEPQATSTEPEPTGPGSQKPQATSSKNRDPL
jgi:hypothetical protein